MRALPAEQPLAMPRAPLHDGRGAARERRSLLQRTGTALARAYLIATTATLGGYGTHEMYRVMATVGPTALQWVFLVLFAITFFWISFSLAQASLGFLYELFFLRRRHDTAATALPQCTAILVPVYNEDPERVAAAIETMMAPLAGTAPRRFAFFVLSDTNAPDAWVREESVVSRLCAQAPDTCPVYYRHRLRNTEKKAGNIADWVARWGGGYEAMIVLDADSLMTPDTLMAMARRLAADPGLGLLQTLPKLVRGRSLFARLQQFAAACYGPVFANGLAAWYGNSGNFWGHNAIIRTRAFAESCHLPRLSGSQPLGGHILSHDFVEAALLRRAGWGVRFDTDLDGSYEEAPPSLIDTLVRDRRWCQGNLQHARVLPARGLRMASRLHLFTGIMTYLSAVMWMLLLVVGLMLALQAATTDPQYFDGPSLFPSWPVFDAARALDLFVVSMAVVVGPKLLGWLRGTVLPRAFVAFGGPLPLTSGVLVETVLSALYAPVMMVSQAAIVAQVLTGRDSGWHPQRRESGPDPWRTVWRTHSVHVVLGVLFALAGWYLSPDLFLWLLPFTAGLVLAPLLSRLSGSIRVANGLRRMAVLRTPEERRVPDLLRSFDDHLDKATAGGSAEPILMLANDDRLRRWHAAQLGTPAAESGDIIDVDHLVAIAKAERSGDDLQKLSAWLSPRECMSLLADAAYLEHLEQTLGRFSDLSVSTEA